MIKCNVTVFGSIVRPVDLKENRNGNPFVTFGVGVKLKGDNESKIITISVSGNGEDEEVLNLEKGDRVKIKGNLFFKRKGDATYYNLSAEEVKKTDKADDSIHGTVSFRGTVGSKGVAEHQSKKGAFRTFDAFSTDKTGEDQFVYTWVHFVDFAEECPEWLVPKAKIEAEGKLEFQVYCGKTSISCRVESMSEWIRENVRQF